VFISPQDPLLAGTRSDANANSFVARLTVGEVDVMLTGDAEAETEARVLQGGGPLECEVLKVAHHGSAYSTTGAFLDAVSPEVGVISAGTSNRYGHPAPDTLHKLEKAGVAIFRTDTDGEVLLQTDGRSYSVTRMGRAGAAVVTPGAEPAEPAAPAAPEVPSGAGDGRVDINSASVDELMSLPGIGRVKARAIVDFRTTNGPFSSVDGLSGVKGIGRKTVEKLAPLVALGGGSASPRAPVAPTPKVAKGASSLPDGGVVEQPGASGGGIDLNAASVSELTTLPGIGRTKAEAIADFRAKSGGFTSVEQLRQVKGIGAKTLEKLRPLVRIGGSAPAQQGTGATAPTAVPSRAAAKSAAAATGVVDLNSATIEQLVTLPGIGRTKAQAIIDRRDASGGFRSVDELRQVKGIGAKTLDKLRPHVSVGGP
jgi:comEA protein